MVFETYWIIAQNGDFWLPKRLKNGLHLVEVSIEPHSVNIKPMGAVRSKAITRNRWDSLKKTPYSGQSFGVALQTLRGSHDKKEAATCPVQQEKPRLADDTTGGRPVAPSPRKGAAGKLSGKQRNAPKHSR